jgi:SAM-dependent methyltransferase
VGSLYSAADPDAYERLMGRWSRRLAPLFLRFADLPPRAAVLDTGCGTGSLAEALAREGHKAVAADIAPPFAAWARDAHRGDKKLRFLVSDVQALPFGAAHFDAAVSLLVLNFVAGPASALREMRRVTKPGGVVAGAVWDFAGGLDYQRIFWDTAAALDFRADIARGRHYGHALLRAGALGDAMRRAGLQAVEETSLTIRMDYADFADYWGPIATAQGPVGDYVRAAEPELLERIRERVRAAFLSGGADGPRSMAATAWAVKARVP